MYPPDGLLTIKGTKHDVKYDPRIIATDPSISDDIDDFPPIDFCLVNTTEELTMNTSEDDPSSGLNGRLRPRKSHVPSPQGKAKIKPEGKTSLDKPKRTNTPSKALPNKQDDLASKSDCLSLPQFLCPYCDKKFATRQTVSKHIRRIHHSTSTQDMSLNCLFCNHTEVDTNLIRHMVDSHPNQYFACLECHTRFPSTTELAEHKLNVCEKQKISFVTKPRPKIARGSKKSKKSLNVSNKGSFSKHGKDFQEGHGFNGIVISCELKPPQDPDGADIEDNITTNLILPPSKKLVSGGGIDKNAVIVLDDIQWNKRIPPNFSFHNTDPDQILSRLGVVHRSPRTGESTRKDWFKALDDATQKFERCFDTKFYSKVASNVQENLTKFLDGSFNFNPDPDSTIKTRKSINNVVINTAEGFPILLASEQYSRSAFDSYMPRAIAPKHKWKWDNLENDRSLMTAAEILKRDSHTNNCIITLVSSLDIWTQLSMRRKFDDKFHVQPVEKKTEKQNIISKELKEILESREIPTSSQIVKKCANKPLQRSGELEFPASLGLVPTAPSYEVRPAVLSGEWVRPRCLVCCACGEQTTDSKGLTLHMSTRHPNASVQCYEIVGEPLLNADILKHLYVPPSPVCNRTRPPRGFRECTKCNKSITLDDLHQHMLDCAGDTPAVRRRQPRQRPFGVRRRRQRIPDNAIRKKIRKDIRSRQRSQKSHVSPRPRIRTEVGDAETIRKMLADLPAKRHRVLVNPLNLMQRPCRKLDIQRSKLMLKKCSAEEVKNRKRNINKGATRAKEESAMSGDQNKNMASFDDDEDNKPLKPKIKLTATTTFRRREPLKRQAVISTVKRKSVRSAKAKIKTATKAEAPIESDIQETSLEKSPLKLDLTKAAYNTREHAANRGTSSNRDGQRPGCSGTNGTANNSCAPAQNVPLKHSIARLTANSETHDKSVQFHHSFLVQQECNNTNQHVPTGDRTLFENEAVVSKLDKPPLNICQKSFMDINFQKNKTNKPRKGLNDCIAMLKNKLVDPVPCSVTGYVSVQCGSDEPIDDEPRVIVAKSNKISADNNDDQTQPPEETTENCEQSASSILQENDVVSTRPETNKEAKENTEQLQPRQELTAIHEIQEPSVPMKQNPENLQLNAELGKINPTFETLHHQEKVIVEPQYGQETSQKVEKSLKGSHSLEKTNLMSQCGEQTARNIKKSSQITPDQEEVNLKTQSRQENEKLSECVYTQGQSGVLPRQETSNIKQNSDFLQIQNKITVEPWDSTHKLKKKTDLRAMSPYRQDTIQQNTSNPESSLPENLISHKKQAVQIFKQNICLPKNLTLTPQYCQETAQQNTDTQRESTMEFSKLSEAKSNVAQKKTELPQDCEITKICGKEVSAISCLHDPGQNRAAGNINDHSIHLSTEAYHVHDTTDIDRLDVKNTWQKPLDIFSEKSASQFSNKQSSYYANSVVLQNNSELESDLILPQDVFSGNIIRDIPSSIPPAHSSNIVESIISAPLDLSSKVPNVTQNLSNPDSYDNYGTLDLSNKNANRTFTSDIPIEEDVIVDLRVKSSYQRGSPVSLDLCVKPGSSKNGDIPEASPDVILYSVPTDLSLRGRGNDSFNKIRNISKSVEIQDLSVTMNKSLQSMRLTTPSEDHKSQKETRESTITRLEATNFTTNSVLVAIPDNTTQKVGTHKSKTCTNITTIIDQSLVSEQKEHPELDVPKTQTDSNQLQVLDKLITNQLQKHVYDPTLKIPQYKIRANVLVTETTPPQLLTSPYSLAPTSAPIVPLSITQDLTISKTSPKPSEIYKTAVTTSIISVGMTTLPKPGQYTLTSVSRIESTTPVYTLANACIAVTKIESSNAAGLTNTLLSIPGSTIASTVPVYTLTGTTVSVPTSFNREISHPSTTRTNYNIFRPDVHINAHITVKGIDDEDLPLDQDPEKAQKIAMLPKALVEILGSMPKDHRNQLLDVLPQYMTTTAANCASTTKRTVTDTTARAKSIEDNIKPSESVNTPIPASSESQSFSRRLKPDISGQRQTVKVDDQHHCISYKETLRIQELSTTNSDESTAENPVRNLIGETELNTPDLPKANINDSVRGDSGQNRVIDLTEDEFLPPLTTAVNISHPISTSSKDASVSGVTGIPCKQKNSDKTASLRAVRIKAPSLRQKEKQKLNLLTEEQVLTQNEQDAVIQLAEMSMSHSQHDRKVVIDSKGLQNNFPVQSANEVAKESVKLPLSINSTVNNEVVKACALKTEPNSATLSVLTSLDCDLSTPGQIIEENDIHKNENATVVGSAAKNVSESDNNFVENIDTNNVNNDNSTKENKDAISLEEEDSEDDIILAAIVNRKRQNKATRSKRITKNKKNKKKLTKNNLLESNHVKTDDSIPISSGVDQLGNVIGGEDSTNNLNISSKASRFKHNKIIGKSKKISQDVNLKPCHEASKRQLSDNKTDSTGSGHNNVPFVECGKENKDNLSNVNKNTQIETIMPNKTKSQEGLLANIEMNLKQSENVLQRAKPKKKKRFSDVNNGNTEQKKAKSRLQIPTSPMKSNAVDQSKTSKTESEVLQNRDLLSKEVSDFECTEPDLEEWNKQDVEELKSEKNKSDKHLCNTSKEEHPINVTQEIENNLDTPLRRSRRGKSLYLDSNLQHESSNIDPTLDQKAPLTKKQLIFSKLLLDEEQFSKSHALPCTSPEKDAINKIDTVNTASSKINDIFEVSIESSTALKRKKSLQLKRKCKKRKSICDNLSEDITITDESDGNQKDTSETFVSAKDTSPSSEIMKCFKPEKQFSNEFNVIQSESDTDNKVNSRPRTDDINQNINTSEKRKISKVSSNIESDHISKPKKTKFKDTDFCEQQEKGAQPSPEIENPMSCVKPKSPNTTCYDVTLAARRTRSKSVAIKTSEAELYDPYNIDLDDMIQKPEPLRKTAAKTKEIKTKGKNTSKSSDFEESKGKEQKTEQNDSKIDKVVDDDKKNISKPSLVLCKKKYNANSSDFKKEVKSKKTSNLMNDQNLNRNYITEDVVSKDTISDSDESSKSDVPLNKYVENKVKKMATTGKPSRLEGEDTSVNCKEQKTGILDINECKKKTFNSTLGKNSVDTDLSNEIEEQMRSEQFMESFGFFSERKPRKSNLLATKKISETFHIIANEGEDLYYGCKERSSKKNLQTDAKKIAEGNNMQQSSLKKNMKRGRKKKYCTKTYTRYCSVCKKEFRRPDNYLRHQMSLPHISKLSEVELKVKTIAIPEEPNYLIAYKQHMDRLKILTEKAAKQKKNSKTKIVLPRLDEILAEVHKTIREQQIARRSLSRDEALFIDCCELLNKPLRPEVSAPVQTPSSAQISNDVQGLSIPQTSSNVQRSSGIETPSGAETSSGAQTKNVAHTSCSLLTSSRAQSTSAISNNVTQPSISSKELKNDDDVDSVTAKTIMESEEVRNLENDLISGLKEAANVKQANKDKYRATSCTMTIHPHEISSEIFSKPDCDIHCQQMKVLPENFSNSVESPELQKTKKHPEYKEKMYPDVIEDIDMFEDKFDKIKRKCRSQAAAAKQVQNVTEPSPGHKGRKKTDKKKGKKISKKNYQSTVMTKGALKGFDGIKVSIPTSDINMSAIVTPHESFQKKKRRPSSKKKREKKDSETSCRYDSDHRLKDGSYSQKKVDVYEFMDNEDAELFEFRPSTLMERFKSINKETPSATKRNESTEDLDNSSESASDGDDFVYMSDDYVCSDDETENSSLSCELGNSKSDTKKLTQLKKKDIVEKNAVMGKIFKHNAVRTEKKNVKSKDTVKPKANLDQLFDSLLEEEPSLALSNNDSHSPKLGVLDTQEQQKSPKYESITQDESKPRCRKPSMSPVKLNIVKPNLPSKNLGEQELDISSSLYDLPERYKCGPSTSKQVTDMYAPSTSATYISSVYSDETLTEKRDSSPHKKHNVLSKNRISPVQEISELERTHAISPTDKLLEFETSAEFDEETGVARHRARRKCTVGKQNILAETWSSESEPDGLPPRPASAESVVASAGRKKKGRKRDGQQAISRRAKVAFNKKQDIESRVSSNKKNTLDSGDSSHVVAGSERSGDGGADANAREVCPPPAAPGPSTSCAASGAGASGSEASTSKARPRPKAYYWTSEGDDEQEQQQQQQHGWIVGNSHKSRYGY